VIPPSRPRKCLPVGPIAIGMPQLGPCGLSENWLLRHLGDLHWRIICDALRTRSKEIADADGHRLYASFVRVTWQASRPLSAFDESDVIAGEIAMVRCGDGLFISDTTLSILEETITVRMVSMFTRRERPASNERLRPSAPAVPADCPIPDVEEIPLYVSEHRLLRTGGLATLDLAGHHFDLTAPTAETVSYRINGYTDFNGANLLYFASYPTLADSCVAASDWVSRTIGARTFVTTWAPLAREVFYFGNADLTDQLRCAIAPPPGSPDPTAYRIDVFRAGDGICIARQFVVRGGADNRL